MIPVGQQLQALRPVALPQGGGEAVGQGQQGEVLSLIHILPSTASRTPGKAERSAQYPLSMSRPTSKLALETVNTS